MEQHERRAFRVLRNVHEFHEYGCADGGDVRDPCFLPLLGCESDLPMPPPGDAENRRVT